MARGVNKVILIGNVGQDPETRYMPSGNPVSNVSLATTDTWTDKQSGQKQERTEWHRLNFFGPLAEVVQKYVTKGSKIYVEGSIHTRKWQDQNGQDRYSTEIKVRDMQMLDGRGQGQGQGQQQGGYQGQQGPQGGGGFNQNAGNQGGQSRQGGQQPNGGGNFGGPDPGQFDDFDDEIPF